MSRPGLPRGRHAPSSRRGVTRGAADEERGMTYLPHTDADRPAMLAAIGVDVARRPLLPHPRGAAARRLDLPPGLTEPETRARHARPWPPATGCAGPPRSWEPAATSTTSPRRCGPWWAAPSSPPPTPPTRPRSARARCRHIFEFQTSDLRAHRAGRGQRLAVRRALGPAEAAFLALRQTRRERIVLSAGRASRDPSRWCAPTRPDRVSPCDVLPLDPERAHPGPRRRRNWPAWGRWSCSSRTSSA